MRFTRPRAIRRVAQGIGGVGGHRACGDLVDTPMAPITPMPDGLRDTEHAEEEEAWTL